MKIFINYLTFLVLSTNTFIFLSAFLRDKTYKDKYKNALYLLVVSFFLTLFDETRTMLGLGYQFIFLNVLSTLGMVTPILFLFRTNSKTKIATLSLRILFISIAEGLTLLIFGPLIGYNNFLAFIVSRMAGFSSLGFDIVLCYLVKIIRKKGVHLTSRLLFLEIVLSILTCLGWNMVQNIVIKNNEAALKSHYYLEFLFGLLLFLFYIGFELANSIQDKRFKSLSEKQLNVLRKKYYKKIEMQQKQIRSIKHDMNNQLVTIKGYLKNGEHIDNALDQLKYLSDVSK